MPLFNLYNSYPKYKKILKQLKASEWVGNQQTISIAGLTANSDVDFGTPTPTTQANALAFSMAGMYVSGLSNNSMTITCLQTPTEDIDTVIKIWS